MSGTDTSTSSRALRWIRPGWFVAGLVAGLGALSWLGWQSGRTNFHPGFSRIYPAISPETNYYPTLDEMIAVVRSRCRHDQVLVIVGGNSILAGVWQPEADLWSKHLQELLGNHYCVINFAFRGGSPTDGGAVVAEVLRREYPHQVYIADEAPFNGVESFAHEPYRYIFWQAYFRGLLIDSAPREMRISQYLWNSGQRRIYTEAKINGWLDRALNYRNLWNRVCFEYFCTVPSYLGDYFPKILTPRRKFADDEPDAYNPDFMKRKYAPAILDAEMNIVRNLTSRFYTRAYDGRWLLSKAKHKELALIYSEAFPKSLIPRTLILVSQSSPYYRSRLTDDERARDVQGYKDSVQLWRDAGFTAEDYGANFSDDDFGDRSHLSKTGGRKLAEAIAPIVGEIAGRTSAQP